MRLVLCFALLCAVTPAHPQGLVGGFAVDSVTGARLPCVDVVLEDTTGRNVERTQTDREGVFQFDAPARGAYRYRFDVWFHAPLFGPTQMLDPSIERAQTFQLTFVPVMPAKLRLWPDTSDSPPGPPQARGGSPPQIPKRGIPGTVTMTYMVDSTGRVPEESIRLVAATDSLLVPPIRSYLGSVLLHPARRGGQPVCALVLNQPFNFRTGR